jgi:hypothetical protein
MAAVSDTKPETAASICTYDINLLKPESKGLAGTSISSFQFSLQLAVERINSLIPPMV